MKTAGLFLIALFVCAIANPQEKYTGPLPPKPDIPFLVHADNLIQTEVVEAQEQQKKDEYIYTIPGASSPARTPLAEPIFLMQSEKIAPESLQLYRLEVKNGNRQIAIPQKGRKGPRTYRLMVSRVAEHLFRIEVNEGLGLENGEYSLSPEKSNTAFCFEVY